MFAESTIATHYATLVCGRAAQRGEIEICNAGHCPPLLLHGGEVTPVEATGLPIGIFAEAEFTSKRIALDPGDAMVIYTDGLSEAQDVSRCEYGAERLMRILRQCHCLGSLQMLEACVQDVEKFRSGEPLGDDLTLMVVRRSG